MSVQFGKINFDGKPVHPEDLAEVRPVLAPFGPDREGYFCEGNLGILYRAFHTTKESRREIQPHVSASGTVLTWEGRLDNREELVGLLGREVSLASTDLQIVAAAHNRWATDSFAKLIGDWSVSIWDPRNQSLLLAKDFIGVRQLYYSMGKDQIRWCSILEPLVYLAGHKLDVDQEYVAGWLGFFPAPHLTPFVGIHSVPPAAFVRVTHDAQTVSRYWNLCQTSRICYRTDAEYEEHFRTVFSESIRRRLRCDAPVMAELSGGMDSSSIVCAADVIIERGLAETSRLDTISFYDDSEPNWNEGAYFKHVEEKRCRIGCHIDTSRQPMLKLGIEPDRFASTPGFFASTENSNKGFAACLRSHNSRVILSGIGGDEVMGGVPTPTPELQDLLRSIDLSTLVRQLAAWALDKRVPWFHLLHEAASGFLPPQFAHSAKHRQPVPWLALEFVRQNREALYGYQKRARLFGPWPSFQENMSTLEAIRRRLACTAAGCDPLYEARYPYLDRHLLQFVFCIPREQLTRPGQRRSLMRRALADIVPAEVRNRRRKGFVTRRLRDALNIENKQLKELVSDMRLASFGIVDQAKFVAWLQKARTGHEFPGVRMARTVCLELWIRSVMGLGIVGDNRATPHRMTIPARNISAEQI